MGVAMKLFCLPNAGGCAANYEMWKRYEGQNQVIPIEYAGRGKRGSELCYDTFMDGVADIFNQIESEYNFQNYAILGHSIGAIYAYEVYYYILKKEKELPKKLFLGGSIPPFKVAYQKKSEFSDEKLIKDLVKNGGIPKEMAQNEQMAKLIAQNVRNDYRISNTYHYEEHRDKLACEVYLLYGKQEIRNILVNRQWNQLTQNKPIMKTISGNHYFVHKEETIRYVMEMLNK